MDSIQQLSSMTKYSSTLLLRSHIQMRPCLSLCFKTLSYFDMSKWSTEAYFLFYRKWFEISLQQLGPMQAVCKRQKPSVAHAWTCWLIKTFLREHKIWLWGKDQNCSVWRTCVWRTQESDRRQRYWHYTDDVVPHLTSRKRHSTLVPTDDWSVREPTISTTAMPHCHNGGGGGGAVGSAGLSIQGVQNDTIVFLNSIMS